MANKYDVVCEECGTHEVRKEAFASWDICLQDWVLVRVEAGGFCVECQKSVNLKSAKMPA